MNSMDFDEIYNQALQMLKSGRSQEEVLFKFAEFKDQLAPLLKLSAKLMDIPKNTVPTPLMQRKYAAAPIKNFWLAWLHLSKFAAASVSLMLLVSAFTVIGYQTSKSSPGQTLFSVKKSTEKLQLILAADQNAKASLQIKFAQKRLNEAEAVFNDTNSNAEEKTAALEELADQTTTAVAEVSTAAQTNPQSSNTQPLIESLEGMADNQQNLLAEIGAGAKIKPAAGTALQTLTKTAEKISAIKHTVAISTSEQALAQLQTSTNSVIILGNITQVGKDKITVEKTDFYITGQTAIKDASGTILSLKDLAKEAKVNVMGQKDKNILTASQIVLIKPELKLPEGLVKEASTTSETLASSAPESSTPVSLKKIKTEDSASTTPPAISNPNAAFGTFIQEDPSPQFSQ